VLAGRPNLDQVHGVKLGTFQLPVTPKTLVVRFKEDANP